MSDWFAVENAGEVPSPALLLYPDRIRENIRRMIRIAGRKDSPGRPFLYETTREFLVAFGLRDLSDLPKVEGELVIPEATAEAASSDAPADTTESAPATDSPQQDPGALAVGYAHKRTRPAPSRAGRVIPPVLPPGPVRLPPHLIPALNRSPAAGPGRSSSRRGRA